MQHLLRRESQIFPSSILYEDQDLIIVDKTAGILIHPTIEAPDRITLVCLLERHFRARIFPVHRLDRNSTGVMVFSKSPQMAASLQSQMNGKGFYKEYLTLVRDHFPSCVVSERSLTGASGEKQEALTSFHPFYFFEKSTLLKAIPITGRRHQIRRHLAHLGHHIIGDSTYGKGKINRYYREKFGLEHMFLHSCRLSFFHPRTHEKCDIYCPLPQNLKRLMASLPIFTPNNTGKVL